MDKDLATDLMKPVVSLDAVVQQAKASNLPTRMWVLWAADCAENVLHLFEAHQPNDSRPRLAIEAARRGGAHAAADAADAADAARAARAAAHAAASYANRITQSSWEAIRLLHYINNKE